MKVSSVQFEMTAVTRSVPCPALPVRALLLAVCHICPSAFCPVFNSAISNGVGCRFLFFNIYFRIFIKRITKIKLSFAYIPSCSAPAVIKLCFLKINRQRSRCVTSHTACLYCVTLHVTCIAEPLDADDLSLSLLFLKAFVLRRLYASHLFSFQPSN